MTKCCPCLHAITDQKIMEFTSKADDINTNPKEDNINTHPKKDKNIHTKKDINTHPKKDINIHPEEDDVLFDESFIMKHFYLPPRPLYLDPYRRPLITFPIADSSQHFNMARKYKINQQILDGYLDPSEAITAPTIFPYPKTEKDQRDKDIDYQYVFELPEGQHKICPVHYKSIETLRTLRCCNCLKSEKEREVNQRRKAGRPHKRPKPWLLSRHTDFDLISQW